MAARILTPLFVILTLVLLACSSDDADDPAATAPTGASPTVELSGGLGTATPAPAGPQPSGEATAAPTAPPEGQSRIQISPENSRYFSWHGELVYPIGNTESGPESCSTANGWLPISSGFDWQPDLENLMAHGGNFIRIVPYFPTHPILPWVQNANGLYDLSQINQEWAQRMQDYVSWTEANNVVVLLEVFENWSFVNEERGYAKGWVENPWNPDNNVNYGTDQISNRTTREDAAIYRALTDDKTAVMALLQQYVAALLDITLPHGNVLYNVTNESNAPLSWSEYWADFIHRYASERGYTVLVGEMPHTYEPNAGLEAVAASPSFDYVDAASHVSDDRFGRDDEAAEVAGTDEVLTGLHAQTTKPLSIGKVYYRSPATLWSKFINGVAAVQYHRNCDRGGSDEDDPQKYFDYVQHLRTFVDQIDLTLPSSIDDGIVTGVTDGVRADVLAAPGSWYVVYLYREADGSATAELNIELPAAGYTARWFDPIRGNWADAVGTDTDAGTTRFVAPRFGNSLALLIQISTS